MGAKVKNFFWKVRFNTKKHPIISPSSKKSIGILGVFWRKGRFEGKNYHERYKYKQAGITQV
jgi:hypothetical protein